MNFASGEAAAIDTWASGGCAGPRRQPDLARHDMLEKRLHQAMLSAGNSCTARDTLAARAAAARKEIGEISDQLHEAAVVSLSAELDVLGARSLALQEELKETQASLLGGHDFLKSLDEQIYASTKKRNAVYSRAVASVTGLAHDLRYEFVTADRQSVQHWSDRFSAIVKGED